jgi:hypothetical protein
VFRFSFLNFDTLEKVPRCAEYKGWHKIRCFDTLKPIVAAIVTLLKNFHGSKALKDPDSTPQAWKYLTSGQPRSESYRDVIVRKPELGQAREAEVGRQGAEQPLVSHVQGLQCRQL